MKLKHMAALIFLLSTGNVLAQTSTPDVIKKTASLNMQISGIKSELFRLIYAPQSVESCNNMKLKIIDSRDQVNSLSDEIKDGLTFENDRGFNRLDAYQSSVKLLVVTSNMLKAVGYLCGNISNSNIDFAEIYMELAESNLDLSDFYLKRARK